MDANLEHRVHLIGYDAGQAGDQLRLTLYWHLIASMHNEMEVAIRLVDGEGQVVAEQHDPPWSGNAAVLSWPDGLAVRDEHTIPLPTDLPASSYHLVVSLRERAENGQDHWLKLEGDGGTDVILGSIPIDSP
jgi:hypothetical protein